MKFRKNCHLGAKLQREYVTRAPKRMLLSLPEYSNRLKQSLLYTLK